MGGLRHFSIPTLRRAKAHMHRAPHAYAYFPVFPAVFCSRDCCASMCMNKHEQARTSMNKHERAVPRSVRYHRLRTEQTRFSRTNALRIGCTLQASQSVQSSRAINLMDVGS